MSSDQTVQQARSNPGNDNLPPFEASNGTRLQAILAIILGFTSSIACIVLGVVLYFLPSPGVTYFLSTSLPYGGPEAIAFTINLAATQCLESLAYVHSVSLRWALIREKRLRYNTNIRLFTSSNSNGPNKWYSNFISAACLVLCYASTPQLFLAGAGASKPTDTLLGQEYLLSDTSINCVALVALGIAFSGQTAIALWCFSVNLRDMPTWAANPLNTALVELHLEKIAHRNGRCMLSALSQKETASIPSYPSTRQPSAIKVRPTLGYIVFFVWALVALAAIWSGVVTGIASATSGDGLGAFSWTAGANCPLCFSDDQYGANLAIDGYAKTMSTNMPYGLQFVLGILFVSVPQLLQALGLHAAELIVNLSRDEESWQQLSVSRKHKAGHALKLPPLIAAIMSWKYCLLFLFKTSMHWLLGQCIVPMFFQGTQGFGLAFDMIYSRIIIYTVCAVALASFITILAYHRPKGPQPATYGHIQTLVDLIDDWKFDDQGRFFWGDKGDTAAKDGIRHAGMSARKEDLEVIRLEHLYAKSS